jgi:hypothetical protein
MELRLQIKANGWVRDKLNVTNNFKNI